MKRDTKIVAAFLGAIPVLILSASALCGWAVAHGASPKWRLPFRLLCHGIAARSLPIDGAAMPICARCTGIYIGLFCGLAVFVLLPHIDRMSLRLMLYAAVVPIGIDGLTQMTGLRESTNALRLATGFVAAFAFGMFALSEVENPQPQAATPS